jgi:peptide/nickel transport system permease protein
MLQYVLKRVLLSLVTLWLLVTVLFLMVSLLPTNIGRAILGNTAPQVAVDNFNKEFGLNDSLITQYGRLLKSLVTFDFGLSWATKRPVWGLISGPLFRSAKLAALSLLLCTPVAIGAGLLAAKFRDSLLDRTIVMVGLATSSIPEFVTAALLAVIFGVQLGWFPSVSSIPDGTSPWGQIQYLLSARSTATTRAPRR